MKLFLSLVLMLVAHCVLARELMPQEMNCLKQIREESDFILSRINSVHQEYEGKLKQSGLVNFEAGNYSTIELLDNTIRKYHRELVHKVKAYPFSYKAKIQRSQAAGSKRCMVDQLQADAVGTIHEFELSWQKALHQAEKNARYFKQVDRLD